MTSLLIGLSILLGLGHGVYPILEIKLDYGLARRIMGQREREGPRLSMFLGS